MTPCRRLTLSVVAFCAALWMCALQAARIEAVPFGFERTAGPISALYAYCVAFGRLLTCRSRAKDACKQQGGLNKGTCSHRNTGPQEAHLQSQVKCQ